MLILLLGVTPWEGARLLAEEFSWKEAQSGSYEDKSRWLMNQGGIGVQAPRAPGSGDTATMKDGEYTVSVSGQNTGSVFAASDNTFAINGSFTIGELTGSPRVVGSGTMVVGDWTLSPSTPSHPNAVIDGAEVRAATFRMPGSNLGVEIANGGRLQCLTYVHGGGFGAKPVWVRGPGSSFEVVNDITQAPQLEIRVSMGGSAVLGGIKGTPAVSGLAEFYIDGASSQLTTADLTTNKFLLTGGADATTSGHAWLSGSNNEVSSGSRWDVAGKLTLIGVFGRILGITGNGIVNAYEVEADNHAEIVLDGGEAEALLFAKTRLTKKAATLRATRGIISCETAELLPGEAGPGQVPVDMIRSTFLVNGVATLDSWARFQGEDAEFLARMCVIGSLANRQGRLELLPGADLAVVEPLIVGDAGNGTVTLRGAAITENVVASLAWQPGSTGQFVLTGGATVPAAGAWIVGKGGTGTLMVGGGSTIRLSEDEALIVAGGDVGSEGTLTVDGDSEITNTFFEGGFPDMALNATLLIGDKGKGTLALGQGRISLSSLRIGRSFEDNSVTVAPGPNEATMTFDDLIIGDGGRGRMKLEAHSSLTADSLIVGSHASLESVLSVDGGASVVCSRGISIGDEGRGSVVCSGSLRAGQRIQVAATRGAVGYLEASGTGAEVSGETGRIVLGGGAAASANGAISLGGRFFAAELTMPPPPDGASTLTVSGAGSQLYIYQQMEIGRLHRSSGPATCTLAGGATGYAGRTLLVGPTGVLNVAGGSMLVGSNAGSPVKPSILRVEPGGHFGLAGTLIGGTEIASGASFSPGASPGVAQIQGGLSLESGSLLDLEIGGTEPGTGYDVVQTTGSLAVRGTVHLRFINGFAPSAGQAFTLVQSAGALTWAPAKVTVEGLGPGFAYTFNPDPTGRVTLTATKVGLATSQPELGIELNRGAIDLWWPAIAGWTLEQSAPAALSTWTAVTPLPSPDSGYYFLSFPLAQPSPASRYYRLRKLP